MSVLPSSNRIGTAFTAVALALGVGSGTFAACGGDPPAQTTGTTASSSTGTGGSGGGDPCPGGYVTPEGECQGKCEKSLCIADNTCIGNQCKLLCDSHTDCFPDGTQACAPATPDDPAEGASVNVCQRNENVPGPGFYTTSCPFATECADFTCPNDVECDRSPCGGDPLDCKQNADCNGDPNCNRGTCGKDGSACLFPTCDLNFCLPTKTTCKTAGEGDADAYCTQFDCKADADCAPGYYCGAQYAPENICGRSCNDGKCSHDAEISCASDGDCQKGNNTLCGKVPSDTPCVDIAASQAAGVQHFEGQFCLMRNVCLKRELCAPCEADLDCSLAEGQRCVTFDGAKICASACGTDKDCGRDNQCLEGACVPRFGSCGKKETHCAPCRNDTDCGEVDDSKDGPKWGCVETTDKLSACLDRAFTTKCATDADCPAAPGGPNGKCLDEDDGVAATDAVYHSCYFAKVGDFYACY